MVSAEVGGQSAQRDALCAEGAPVHSSHSTTPREYTSARCEQRSPRSSSGACVCAGTRQGTLRQLLKCLAVRCQVHCEPGCVLPRSRPAVSGCQPCGAQHGCFPSHILRPEACTLHSPPRRGCQLPCWRSGSRAACTAPCPRRRFLRCHRLPAALQGAGMTLKDDLPPLQQQPVEATGCGCLAVKHV